MTKKGFTKANGQFIEGVDEDALYPTDYDEAVVGVDYDGRLVMDAQKMVDICMKELKCDYEDAVDYLNYNTYCVKGDNHPVYVWFQDE